MILENTKKFRAGYVSIVGLPNVGKSTLLNAFVGEKLSIVTPKPQTTRNQIRGILTTENYQMVFVDTPGLIDPKYQLHRFMLREAYTAIDSADLVLYLIDSTYPISKIHDNIFNRLEKIDNKVILVLNKIDRVKKDCLLPLIANFNEKFPTALIFPISALKNEGITELCNLMVDRLPESPKYFLEDELSDLPQRFFVAEMIREKIFIETRAEIPYSTGIQIEEFREREKRKIFIRASIWVERKSQKGILIGKGGSMVKKIGQLVRRELEEFLRSPVFLELNVSVKREWRNDQNKLADLGYQTDTMKM